MRQHMKSRINLASNLDAEEHEGQAPNESPESKLDHAFLMKEQFDRAFKENKLDEAEKWFQLASKLLTEIIDFLRPHVFIFSNGDEKKRPIEMNEQTREMIFRFIEAITNLAQMQMDFKRYKEAEISFQEFLLLREYVVDSVASDTFNLGTIYKERYKDSKDISHLRQSSLYFVDSIMEYRKLEFEDGQDAAEELIENFNLAAQEFYHSEFKFLELPQAERNLLCTIICEVLTEGQLKELAQSDGKSLEFLVSLNWTQPVYRIKGFVKQQCEEIRNIQSNLGLISRKVQSKEMDAVLCPVFKKAFADLENTFKQTEVKYFPYQIVDKRNHLQRVLYLVPPAEFQESPNAEKFVKAVKNFLFRNKDKKIRVRENHIVINTLEGNPQQTFLVQTGADSKKPKEQATVNFASMPNGTVAVVLSSAVAAYSLLKDKVDAYEPSTMNEEVEPSPPKTAQRPAPQKITTEPELIILKSHKAHEVVRIREEPLLLDARELKKSKPDDHDSAQMERGEKSSETDPVRGHLFGNASLFKGLNKKTLELIEQIKADEEAARKAREDAEKKKEEISKSENEVKFFKQQLASQEERLLERLEKEAQLKKREREEAEKEKEELEKRAKAQAEEAQELRTALAKFDSFKSF